MKKEEIQKQADEIFAVIKHMIENSDVDYVQSWWINPQNCYLSSGLKTPQINQRCKLLIKQGKLQIDKANTSTSCGTSYKLTKIQA